MEEDKVLNKILKAIEKWSKGGCIYFEPDVCDTCDKLRKKIKKLLNTN
jgi:hypothetical protein